MTTPRNRESWPALRLPCPAKLNLFLHITGQRPNGYHDLQTVFQLLDFNDWLTISSLQSDTLSLHCQRGDVDITEVPAEDNLILEAARKLRQFRSDDNPPGASITLEKNIPMGAGLGGGSSDAATALLGLNCVWNMGLSTDELSEIGLTLGADVPVFIRGRTAWGEGVGERLTAINLPQKFYLVVIPSCHVSTAAIFSNQQLTRDSTAIKMADFLAADLNSGAFGHGTRSVKNDCEPVVRRLYPEVDEALKWLSQFGDARLTGTGASIFAGFDSETEAQALLSGVPENMTAFVAKGLRVSPVSDRIRAGNSNL